MCEQYHSYREAYGAEKEAFVEFIDVGGHPKYEISRPMFYYDVHGACDGCCFCCENALSWRLTALAACRVCSAKA